MAVALPIPRLAPVTRARFGLSPSGMLRCLAEVPTPRRCGRRWLTRRQPVGAAPVPAARTHDVAASMAASPS